jgi:carboxylesterase type B
LIFKINILKDTYQSVRETLLGQVQDATFADAVLGEYGITPNLSGQELIDRTCEMGAEAVSKSENYQTALFNSKLENRLFKYHLDQRSQLPNILQGKAYHGLDVLYLFMNLENKLDDYERKMSRYLASAWILFARGQAPWPSGSGHGAWKIWGPDSGERVETEEEGKKIRSYSRFNRLLLLGSGRMKYMRGLSYLLVKRGNLGKFITDTENHDNGETV